MRWTRRPHVGVSTAAFVDSTQLWGEVPASSHDLSRRFPADDQLPTLSTRVAFSGSSEGRGKLR